jgi:signal transduction histidine kinase
MPRNPSKRSPDRTNTDKNLHSERLNADKALAKKTAKVEAHSDDVVDRARDRADAVLEEARGQADDRLDSATSNSAVRAIIEEQRKVEDHAVEAERATHDDNLLQEREEHARNLLDLLPMERLITDRSLQTERVRSDDAVTHRDDFLGMVSHDLRDLLGGIVTSASLLARTAATDAAGDPTRAGAERIRRYAARMKRLIEDLTDVVSIDAGKLAVAPMPGDMAPVISEAVSAMHGLATAKDISLNVTQPEVPLTAVFDSHRVLQVLTNLIANAIKFTPAGGKIRVDYGHSGDTARVSVVDTGVGVAPDLIEAIFERFRQVATTERRGLGLGLYISRCLIEAQGGKIWAQSIEGQGTSVTFTLPMK